MKLQKVILYILQVCWIGMTFILVANSSSGYFLLKDNSIGSLFYYIITILFIFYFTFVKLNEM